MYNRVVKTNVRELRKPTTVTDDSEHQLHGRTKQHTVTHSQIYRQICINKSYENVLVIFIHKRSWTSVTAGVQRTDTRHENAGHGKQTIGERFIQ